MKASAERTEGPSSLSRAAQLANLVTVQAGVGVEGLVKDQLRRVVGHLLDVHATLAGDDQHRPGGRPIDDDAQVQLAGDLAAFFHQHLADGLTGRPGLDGDQGLAQQGPGHFAGLFGAFDQLHAALLGVGFDRSLAAAAGVDLRLDHGQRSAQRGEGRRRFFGSSGNHPLGTATPARRRISLA